MVKYLDPQDFRLQRKILEPKDFAISSGRPDSPPPDLIDQETWDHLTTLPTDVAIRTTNYFGTTIKRINDINAEWLMQIELDNSYLSHAMLPAYEELQGATFSLLHGYYKQSFEGLRNFVEQTVVGVYVEIYNNQVLAEEWESGSREIKCGEACDNLSKRMLKLEKYLTNNASDNFFEQKDKIKNPNNERGWVRRLFGKLSKFPHPNPGHANGDLWSSNGPIFELRTFNRLIDCYLETMMLGFLLLKLARKKFSLTPVLYELSQSDTIQKISIARVSIAYLFKI